MSRVRQSEIAMCLIAFAWQAHPRYDLIVAANRDEYFQRPTRPAHWWPEAATVYGGRDQRAGGAWCAADRSGRFAAVTNVRETGAQQQLRSRGELVYDALTGPQPLDVYSRYLDANRNDYGPFNLLLADRGQLRFISNRGQQQGATLQPGVYALSNGHWHEDWPKSIRARDGLQRLLRADEVTAATLFALLGQTNPVASDAAPNMTIGPDTEQLLSALFVRSATYGTRASTLVLRDRAGNMDFHERAFDQQAHILHDQHEHWSLA